MAQAQESLLDPVAKAWNVAQAHIRPTAERTNFLPMWQETFGRDLVQRVLWVDPPRAFRPDSGPARVNILVGSVDADINMDSTKQEMAARLKSYAETRITAPFGNENAKRMPSFTLEGTRYDAEKHVMMLSYIVSSEPVIERSLTYAVPRKTEK
jgi:hypothetical protein